MSTSPKIPGDSRSVSTPSVLTEQTVHVAGSKVKMTSSSATADGWLRHEPPLQEALRLADFFVPSVSPLDPEKLIRFLMSQATTRIDAKELKSNDQRACVVQALNQALRREGSCLTDIELIGQLVPDKATTSLTTAFAKSATAKSLKLTDWHLPDGVRQALLQSGTIDISGNAQTTVLVKRDIAPAA